MAAAQSEPFFIRRPQLDRYQRAATENLIIENYSSAAGGMQSCGALHRISINRTDHHRYAYRYDAGRFRAVERPAFTLELQPAGHLLEVEGDQAKYISVFQDPRVFRNVGWPGHVEDLTNAHTLSARVDKSTLRLALALVALAQEDDAIDPLLAEHLGHALARCVIRLLGLQPSAASRGPALDNSRLRRVIDYVEAELARQDLTIETLANIAQASQSQFSRAFKEACGTTPYQFILERRVERARRLLSQGRLPLSEVAFAAGFSSQAHFSTIFRRFTGATPKQFRQACSQ